ncbi:MAG: hypothetical protein HUU54_04305 [Ignavibacteriaceae bacterium]|nr:hypothetical protein [Ignavibacteriaceae bacterium]
MDERYFGSADLHMHTTVSDGTMSPQAVVNEVVIQNLISERSSGRRVYDVIAVTDHDAIEGATTAIEYLDSHYETGTLEIIVGAEVSSKDGHILALDIKKNVRKDMSALDTITAIHDQGGIAIAAHPFAYIPFMKGLKGIGKFIYDENIGPLLDAVEIRNANPTETINNLVTQFINSITFKKPVCGGSDSHFQSAIGKSYTIFEGRTKEDLFASIRAGTVRAKGYVYGLPSIYNYIRDRLKWKRFCLEDPLHRVYHDW